MKKFKVYLLFLSFFSLPLICNAADLQSLKVDFLQGNYRRVIFEGQLQAEGQEIRDLEELNYILGLSYLKETKTDLARACFNKVLKNKKSKFFSQASLGLGDSFLIAGSFREAEEVYNQLIIEQPNTPYKGQILYRLVQIEFKKGNYQKGNEYLAKIKKDFPLSPELRPNKGIEVMRKGADKPVKETNEYALQAGFFSSYSNADKFKDLLVSKGFPAYVENSQGGFRVKIGKFKTEEETLAWEGKLAREGYQSKLCE